MNSYRSEPVSSSVSVFTAFEPRTNTSFESLKPSASLSAVGWTNSNAPTSLRLVPSPFPSSGRPTPSRSQAIPVKFVTRSMQGEFDCSRGVT